MALFIMNENYEYDEVTAFLESLEQDVECVLTEAALKQSSKAVRDAKRAARFKVNDLKQEPALKQKLITNKVSKALILKDVVV